MVRKTHPTEKLRLHRLESLCHRFKEPFKAELAKAPGSPIPQLFFSKPCLLARFMVILID